MTIDEFREQIKRPCVRYEIGGFRPSTDPLESWFGRVNVCSAGETWPESNGQPMWPLGQINLKQLSFRPARLEDLEFISIFIDSTRLPVDTPNGKGWCLRAYKNCGALVPLETPPIQTWIKPFPMRATPPCDDFPCREDIPIGLPEDLRENYNDLFENVNGFKLGGWPTLIQSEIFWGPNNEHPANPEFVLQIDWLLVLGRWWCWVFWARNYARTRG